MENTLRVPSDSANLFQVSSFACEIPKEFVALDHMTTGS